MEAANPADVEQAFRVCAFRSRSVPVPFLVLCSGRPSLTYIFHGNARARFFLSPYRLAENTTAFNLDHANKLLFVDVVLCPAPCQEKKSQQNLRTILSLLGLAVIHFKYVD